MPGRFLRWNLGKDKQREPQQQQQQQQSPAPRLDLLRRRFNVSLIGRNQQQRSSRRTSKGSLSIPSTVHSSEEFSLQPSVKSCPSRRRRPVGRFPTRSSSSCSNDVQRYHQQVTQQQQQSWNDNNDNDNEQTHHPFITHMCSSIPILADESHRYLLHQRTSNDEATLELASKSNPSATATMTRLPNIDDVFTIQDSDRDEDTSSAASVIVFRQLHSLNSNQGGGSCFRYKIYAIRPLWQGQSTSSRYPNFHFWGHVLVVDGNNNNNTANNNMSIDAIREEDEQSASSASTNATSSTNASNCTRVIWLLHEAGVPESRVRNLNQVSTKYIAKQQHHAIGSDETTTLRRRKAKWVTIQKQQSNIMTCARLVPEDDKSNSSARTQESYRELVVRPGHDAGLLLCFVGILDDLERLQK